jgi:predicted dehydrogenase
VGTRNKDAGLGDFDDTVAATLRFDDGRLAQFVVSYAGSSFCASTVVGTKGVVEISPAYTFQAALQQRWTMEGKKPKENKFDAVDQFCGETRYFSQCVLEGRDPEPDAEEGLLDVRVIEAVRRALETGEVQKLQPWTRRRAVDAGQEKSISQKKQPDLVHAAAPAEKKAV